MKDHLKSTWFGPSTKLSLTLLVLSLPSPGAPPKPAPWSLQPLNPPSVPAEGQFHPIDAFIDARLGVAGLHRAPRADRRTLIRRLTFGLTGLPPTSHELREFVAAQGSPASEETAYQNLVDRLLASPRYGEHWARHWLDVAQYADTHGNDHDYRRPNAWPYRDYVIRAFNEDKPYARFVEEQIAGDALFPDSPDATIALGFLAAGPWDDTLMITIRPDTVDHRISQNLDRDAMVSAVMGTFQSLTVHCARCHDHKFDPVSQREYYALQAVFAGCDRADRPIDSDPGLHARRARLRERKLAIQRRDPQLLDTIEFEARLTAFEQQFADKVDRWKMVQIVSVVSETAKGTTFERQGDGSWFVSGERPVKDTFTVTAATALPEIRGLKLEVLPDERLPVGGPGRYDNGNFHLAEFRAAARPAAKDKDGNVIAETPVVIASVMADHSDRGDVVANTLDGKADTYWSIHPHYDKPHRAIFTLGEPLQHRDGSELTVSLQFTGKDGHQIGRFRLWACAETPVAEDALPAELLEELATLLRIPADQRTKGQKAEVLFRILAGEVDRELAALPEPVQQVYAVTHDFKPENGFTPALTPRPIHLLHRGEIDQHGDLVEPAALDCIPGLSGRLTVANQLDESTRRAALARWITDERNVLTWRSIVNRVWHWHFGQGLSRTPNDFGSMGDAPSHPELMDWLAVWFRDEAKGSFKKLHRLIMTSETYRQRVLDDPRLLAQRRDTENRLHWRMNRQRLTAEQVRDAVLHLGSRLDARRGGPPALHFNHKGDQTFKNSAPPFVDYANFDRDSPDSRRRAIYRFIFRTVPDPLMDALGCPDGSGAVPSRATSSTAQQALAMLNDAFLIRQGEHLAARIKAEHKEGTPRQQVQAAFELILQRVPTEGEGTELATYVTRHGLANACHLLLNTNEFLYLD